MTDPTPTRPGELGRHEAHKIAEATLATARDEFEFRLKTLRSLDRLEIAVNGLHAALEEHKGDDARQLQQIRDKLGGVSSSVDDNEREFSKYDGIKIGIGFAATFFLAVGAAVWTIFTFFASNKP